MKWEGGSKRNALPGVSFREPAWNEALINLNGYHDENEPDAFASQIEDLEVDFDNHFVAT